MEGFQIDPAFAAMRELGKSFERAAAILAATPLSWHKQPRSVRRAERRRDAERRQERYENTPTFDKLAAVAERRGSSARERHRLLTTALA